MEFCKKVNGNLQKIVVDLITYCFFWKLSDLEFVMVCIFLIFKGKCICSNLKGTYTVKVSSILVIVGSCWKLERKIARWKDQTFRNKKSSTSAGRSNSGRNDQSIRTTYEKSPRKWWVSMFSLFARKLSLVYNSPKEQSLLLSFREVFLKNVLAKLN